MMALLSVDANEITPLALADKSVALTGSVRGAVFIVDELANELYFMIWAPWTPAGKLELRIPLTKKNMAGACILSKEIINIPDAYRPGF